VRHLSRGRAIEIGSIWFSPLLQRIRAATEPNFLLMQYAMDDDQRLVWRCSAANQASMKAALRYGLAPEGIWRGAAFAKGWRNDLAWHSSLADEWPQRRAAIETWLADGNFDASGRARSRPSSIGC
jgi:RimJ/RimL family protein N-acetyltransferase